MIKRRNNKTNRYVMFSEVISLVFWNFLETYKLLITVCSVS